MKSVVNESTVGVISPAFIPVDDRMDKGIQYLKDRGFKVKLADHVGKTHRYFAGTDEERRDDIHQMFSDPEVDILTSSVKIQN